MKYLIFVLILSASLAYVIVPTEITSVTIAHNTLPSDLMNEFGCSYDDLSSFALANETTIDAIVHELRILSFYRAHRVQALNISAEFGIPKGFTLAVAKVESGIGESRMFKEANNVFNIKCHKTHCLVNHCIVHEDDSPDDRFVKFESIFESYQAFGKKLTQEKRYVKQIRIHKCSKEDGYNWAKAVHKAGYATDKNWANKVNAEIKKYHLNDHLAFMVLYNSYCVTDELPDYGI